MDYWNQDNFAGLLRLADELDGDAVLRPLADYCRLRERGLRRDALRVLEDFVSASRGLDPARARAAAVAILEANARIAQAHQFLATPLLRGFVKPTLEAWLQQDADAHVPLRWLGMLGRDPARLVRALTLRPDDAPVRAALVAFALDDVAYATHHLDESFFIGSVEDAVAALERAARLVAEAPDRTTLAPLADEQQQLACLVDDWKSYCEAPHGSFPEWCEARGRRYAYPVKVYYADP